LVEVWFRGRGRVVAHGWDEHIGDGTQRANLGRRSAGGEPRAWEEPTTAAVVRRKCWRSCAHLLALRVCRDVLRDPQRERGDCACGVG
jgi:hypothetical protein